MGGASERTPSFEKINYGLRPAKNIERKMICEALRRLSAFGKPSRYRYIGMGSPYFGDFSLFHRCLGIENMVSIEKEVAKRERFKFNRPYRCVRLKFGLTTAVLPKLGWSAKTILWLDYDGKLEASMLADVEWFCAEAVSGSVILVTVNASPDDLTGGSSRLERLVKRVGKGKVPQDVDDRDLKKWGTASVCRRIITNQILETLNQRNGPIVAPERFKYKQLFNFHYADNAKMLTVGGILYRAKQAAKVEGNLFDDLGFVRYGEDPYLIEAPNLTYRELRHLDAQLPIAGRTLNAPGVPAEDVEKYARVYRYFPTFAEAEI